MDVHTQVADAATAIREATGRQSHDVAVVLGSGLGSYAVRYPDSEAVAYADIPGFAVPKAVGHSGSMHSVVVGDNRILLFAGRAHVYEGHDLDTVVLPVRAAIAAGCSTIVLTNAAGAIPAHLAPGDLTVLSDHINLAGRNPLVGPNDDRLGPRFPDMTDLYTADLRRAALAVATEQGMTMHESVYAWWLGPSFETPAEIRMIRTLGADVVGMSTVPEVIAARHMGARVAAFSLVTNRAAGLSGEPLSSDEVMAVAASVRPTIETYMDRFLARPELGQPSGVA